jgi:predicted O-methyltransferase YrrM
MLKSLQYIFDNSAIKVSETESTKIHSHTPKEQGLFLQKIFDLVKPRKSLEVGLAYGVSALFILEKHREYGNPAKSHIIIEPFPWQGVAEYNIKEEGLTEYADFHYKKSDEVLPVLYHNNEHIQFAYVDTTKIFDVVIQDFYFIDKILDVGGAIILDDCGGSWTGIQKVARFINSLPHYKLIDGVGQSSETSKRKFARKVFINLIRLVPFKKKFFPYSNFLTDHELGLNYNCLAFQKVSEDARDWRWDAAF